jgi:16S rRNA (uracil1498-N3)-methyltransferase
VSGAGVPGSAHRAAAAQVLVASVEQPHLDDDALHHLRRVLRLRTGEIVCATDGRGAWGLTEFTGDADLAPTGSAGHQPRPEPELTVAFVPVKGDRPELVVQKLTEVGVDRILICSSERAVVRWDGDRATRHRDRLRRVAAEASQQCRRLWLPEVDQAELADLVAAGAVLADLGGRPPEAGDRTVVIGPEGGWSPAERAGAPAVGLGTNVLRAETAAITAGVLLTAVRSGWSSGPT